MRSEFRIENYFNGEGLTTLEQLTKMSPTFDPKNTVSMMVKFMCLLSEVIREDLMLTCNRMHNHNGEGYYTEHHALKFEKGGAAVHTLNLDWTMPVPGSITTFPMFCFTKGMKVYYGTSMNDNLVDPWISRAYTRVSNGVWDPSEFRSLVPSKLFGV